MQYSQEHLKTMVYAEFGGQTECIMGNWKIENGGGDFCRLPPPPLKNLDARPLGTFETKMVARTR